MKLILVALSTALLATACANPGIVPLSPDTYMLSRTDKAGVFGNASAMKADVIREASEFAESQGKVAIPIFMHETPVYVGHMATIDYQFRVVSKDDPEVRRVSLKPLPNMVIEKTEKATIDVTRTENTLAKTDVYAEIMKLDDLRKRGLLNDSEFNEQKRKVLSGN